MLALMACKHSVSYEPRDRARFAVELTLADLSVRKAEIEITLPEGYRQTSPGIHDAYFARPKDKVSFNVVRLSPIDDLGLHDPRPCGQDPAFASRLKQLASERFGERGVLELCETSDEDGPIQFWVRASLPVEDNWIECHGHMDGTDTEHGVDASDYTERQREQVLAVCRSMRIVSLGPRVPIDQQH